MTPDRLFDEISRYNSCLACPISIGSGPSSLLEDNPIRVIVGMLKISFGMLPRRLLLEMLNFSRTLRFPKLGGIFPYNWLDYRRSSVS